MNLDEIEHKSEMMEKAIQDGCITVRDYNMWLNGYAIGYKEMSEECTKIIGGKDAKL